MAFKAELEQWSLGAKAFESGNFEHALQIFEDMSFNSKVHFNIGIVHFAKQDFTSAISSFTKAVKLDNYLSIAYFQRGVSYMHLLDNESAFEDFNDAILYLRGNRFIDYTQLGLEFRLQASEILYNRALALFNLGSQAEGMNDLLAALKDKETLVKKLIMHAMDKKGKDCPIFSLPDSSLFRPCEDMLRNTKKVDYLGQAKVIASNTQSNLMRKKTNKKFPEVKTPMQDDRVVYFSTKTNNTKSATNAAIKNAKENIQVARSMTYDGFSKVASNRKQSINVHNNQLINRKLSNFDNNYSSSLPMTPISVANEDSFFRIQQSKESNSYNHSANTSASFRDDSTEFELNLLNEKTIRPKKLSLPNNKMKVKLHYGDTRILVVEKSISFDNLFTKIKSKLNITEDGFVLKYKDEDEELILLTDQEDLNMALSALCTNPTPGISHLDPASGFDGRFEIWCFLSKN